ncbi:CHAD domain-containing protein [Conexibacter sp. SYSU D00693]|uniref:CHAD domain-containing protein n=1 Tax=Conexibacter sp. SYSU D00693 TaxID=2812560 RepID=UPI00196B7432|nr:CHAD domain-containing protein [Conexibacter sp. SYSU D00693]
MRRPTAELAGEHPQDPEAATAQVCALLGAEPRDARVADRVLLDTFDGSLRAAGLVAERPAGGRGAALGAPESDEVRKARGIRALLPVVRVRSEVQELAVLDDEGKTVVRAELELPHALPDGEAPVALPARLRLRGVLGYDKAFKRALRALEDGGGWGAPDATLFDEAAVAVGRDPRGTSSKVQVELERGMRADAAAGLLLARLADVAQQNVAGTLEDVDTEFLHDLRVAVRRARSVLRELQGVHEPAQRAHVREELKWVQSATGLVRDLDVQLLDWDELVGALHDDRREDLEPLRATLERRRSRALRRLRQDLRGPRFAGALEAWRELAVSPPAAPGDPDRPRAALPVEEVAADRIERVYRRMVRDGKAIDEDTPAEALHELRKRGKELRYLLELFGGLFPAEVVKPMVKTLKGLQDVLGRFQDRAVQAELLEEAGRELVQHATGPAALMALGLVVEELHADQRAARDEFHERFAAFAAKDQRKLVRATFPALERA